MREPLQVGPVVAAPGQKVHGYLPVPGVQEIPMTLVAGERSGPTLLVSAGVHGGEYPAIAAAIRLARELSPQTLTGRVIILHIVSPASFFAKTAYVVPLDGKNLNRSFPGRARGSAAERIAHTVVHEALAKADAWVDLHGGDIHEVVVPFTMVPGAGERDVLERSLQLAEAFGIEHVVPGDDLEGTGYAAAAALGVPAILAAAGGAGRYDVQSESIHVRGVKAVMGELGIGPAVTRTQGPVTVHRAFPWIRAGADGLFYPEVAVGERVKQGQTVGELHDVFGDTVEYYEAPADGILLFLATSLAITAGDPLMAVAVD